ncbi:MAG: hypothetical protein ACRDOE_00530 [Streptosporangiaceae bacterium]
MARRGRISVKGVVVTAAVALAVVLGYDHYKHNMSGPVAGPRPGSYQ